MEIGEQFMRDVVAAATSDDLLPNRLMAHKYINID
jgi:hypothetical protein